jgi:hypothetical protein
MASKAEIKKILDFLRGSYIRLVRSWSDDDWNLTMRAYHATLQDLPYPALRAAAVHWSASSKWFPSVAELRQTVVQLSNPTMPTAEAAWEEAAKLIGRHLWRDPDNGLVFRDVQASDCSHPLVFRTIKALGIKALRESDKPGVDRAQFCRFYDSFRERDQADAAMLPEVREAVGRLAERAQAQIAAVTEARRM